MTAPTRRIFAGTEFTKFRPIEDDLDPAANTARGVGLVLPDRLQAFEHQRRVNVLHGQIADDGMDIAIKRIAPLLPMLGIAPAGLMRRDVSFGALLEGDRPGLLDQLGATLFTPMLQRIDFFCSQTARFGRQFSRALEWNCRRTTETDAVL